MRKLYSGRLLPKWGVNQICPSSTSANKKWPENELFWFRDTVPLVAFFFFHYNGFNALSLPGRVAPIWELRSQKAIKLRVIYFNICIFWNILWRNRVVPWARMRSRNQRCCPKWGKRIIGLYGVGDGISKVSLFLSIL